jgi:hypothetical protein
VPVSRRPDETLLDSSGTGGRLTVERFESSPLLQMYLSAGQDELETKAHELGVFAFANYPLIPIYFALMMMFLIAVFAIIVPARAMDRSYRRESGIGMEVFDE